LLDFPSGRKIALLYDISLNIKPQSVYSFMFLRLQILTLAYAFVFRGKKNPHYSKK